MKHLLLTLSFLILTCADPLVAYIQCSGFFESLLTDTRNNLSTEQIEAASNQSAVARPTPNCGPSVAGIPCSPEISRTPFETPVYRKPPDDSVAVGSLLEAAGYAIASNSDWEDISAGNFCGGTETELVLVKNKHSYFSILRGPAPYAVGTGDLTSSSANPWQAVTAANLDGGVYDEIVAIRKKTVAGMPDLVVTRANDSTCDVTTVVASLNIGNPSNSEWLDAAVGRFDRTGTKQIALLKAAHSNLFLVNFTAPGTLTITHSSDLSNSPTSKWKVLGAGDIDRDGVDELIAARQVSDNVSPTVLAYKWNGSAFQVFATSKFGNNGNSDWSGMAVGDFNADGRSAIVLVKNRHSNFVVLDFLPGTGELRSLSTADLDSVPQQQWRGIVATDWLKGSDNGASELIAVRAARDPYRADLLVYGDHINRVPRETAVERTKAWWDHEPTIPIPELKALLKDTHTNTLNFNLAQVDHYLKLVEFLNCQETFVLTANSYGSG